MKPFVFARRDPVRRGVAALRRDTSGATAVEFAIVGPIFFIFAFGIVQFGMAFFNGTSMQWAVERAVRTAMVQDDVTQAQIQALVDDSIDELGTTPVVVSYVVDDSGTVPIAHVTASFSVPVDVPFIDGFSIPFSVDSYIPVWIDP